MDRHRDKFSTTFSLIIPVLPFGNQQQGNKTKPPGECTEGWRNFEIPVPNLARISPPWSVLKQLREVSLYRPHSYHQLSTATLKYLNPSSGLRDPDPKLHSTKPSVTHVDVIVRKRSWPAVSQIWSFTFSPLISTVRILKSTPMVVM